MGQKYYLHMLSNDDHMKFFIILKSNHNLHSDCSRSGWRIGFERRVATKETTMKYFRPLSKSMIEKLEQCRQSELQEFTKKPFTIEDMNYAVAPLFKRGLIEIKRENVENKLLHCVHVTKDGVEYLEKLGIGIEKPAQ